jgi:ketosteroid isomerase-like protein
MTVIDQAVVETAADAFNAHDLERLSALLHEDVAFRAPGGIQGEGRAACVDFYRRWFAEFPDARFDVRTTQIVDGIAVEEGTFIGTHTGVAPTGRPVALDYVQVLRLRDGKHVSVELMFDRLLMLEQLGLAQEAESGP